MGLLDAAPVRVEKASHEDDDKLLKRQANHDDVGNPLICRLLSNTRSLFVYQFVFGPR